MSIVAELKADLEQKRQGLIREEERLGQEARRIEEELQLVRRYRQGLDEILGQTPARTPRMVKEKPANLAERTRYLQSMIGGALEAVYPQGLDSHELLERLQPHWPHGTLSTRQIGQMARLNPAVVNDGNKWYWVPPADPPHEN